MAINVGLTGGTAPRNSGPGHSGGEFVRQRGGKAPGEPRYYNKASGKMETAKAMRGYRAPANQRVSAAARAMGAPRAHAAAPPAKPAPQPKSTPYVHALGTTFGFPAAKGRGIEGLINAAQGAERKVALAPYQQKAGEIGNTERTVSGRVGAFNQQAQNAFQGIVGQQEGSAKTFENNAAETALQSQKNIETAGQNAITSSGGYLDPQLRAQIAASQAEITGLGQAATTRANELGNAQNAYMRQLQAAGVQRGQENQREIGNIYGAERARNTAAENQALGRLEAKAKAERITIPKELRTQELLESKLRQTGELGQEKVGIAAQKNQVTARGQNLTRGARAETNAVGRARVGATERGQNLLAQYHAAALGEKERLDTANIRDKEGKLRVAIQKASKGKPIPAGTMRQYINEFGTALRAFETAGALAGGKKQAAPNYTDVRNKLGKGYKAYEVNGKESLKKVSTVTNGVLLKAAEEIWRTHYVGNQTKAALRQLGLPDTGWNAYLG